MLGGEMGQLRLHPSDLQAGVQGGLEKQEASL